MKEGSNKSAKGKAGVQCVEVLISRSNIVRRNDNLLWTLSVYSLENQPVRKDRELHNSEIFHFMVFDWNRTIKKLLENHKVPFSIIQFFSPETIYADASNQDYSTSDNEAIILTAIENLSQIHPESGVATAVHQSDKASADLLR